MVEPLFAVGARRAVADEAGNGGLQVVGHLCLVAKTVGRGGDAR